MATEPSRRPRDDLSADGIARRTFSTSFRGFDQLEVRGFLNAVAGELRSLVDRQGQLRQELEETRARLAAAEEADIHRLTTVLGEETARVLEAARDAAAQMRARAEESAAALLQEASEEAARVRAEADAVLTRRTEEADAEAARIRAAAEEIRAAAAAAADGEVEVARQRGREMVAEAQLVRERVLRDLARRRKLARQQLEQLRAGRDRLLEAYRVVRRTLDEATGELSVAMTEAKAAAESAGRRAAEAEEPGPEELEAELAAVRLSRGGGVMAGDTGDEEPAGVPTAAGDGGRPWSASWQQAEQAPAGERSSAGAAPSAPTVGPPRGADDRGAAGDGGGDGNGGREPAERPATVLRFGDGIDEPPAVTLPPVAGPPALAPSGRRRFRRRPEPEPQPEPAADLPGGPATWQPLEGGSPFEAVRVIPGDPHPEGDRAPGPAGAPPAPEPQTAERPTADAPAGAGAASSAGAVPGPSPAPPAPPPMAAADAAGSSADAPSASVPSAGPASPSTTDAPPADPAAASASATAAPPADPGAASPSATDAPPADPAAASASATDPGAASPSATDVPSEPSPVLPTTEPPGEPEVPGPAPSEPSPTVPPTEPLPSEPPTEPLPSEPPTEPVPPRPEPIAPQVEPPDEPPPAPVAERRPTVDELFARIKASRAEAVARAEEVLAADRPAAAPTPAPPTAADRDARADGDGAGDEPPAEAPDPAATLLRQRDDALAAPERSLSRKLKRSLSDEQNRLLDTLRRQRGAASLDDLVGGPEDHRSRIAGLVTPDLVAAASAGAGTAAGAPEQPGDLESRVHPVAVDLAAALVDPLRDRIERAVTESAGDEEDVAERLRACYREWKTQRVGDVTRHATAAAYAVGVVAAAPAGTRLCWLVDTGGAPCPDAEDNALAGAVPTGEPFPTGHTVPPAHPGCRCLAVPEDALRPR
jgi:DivIVA domain-containing protein